MRNSSFKLALLFTTALSLAAPVHAQDASGGVGSDIVVTARRVEERLQDVPISISVYTQTDLANRNISNIGDLGTYTPSLATNSRFGPEKSSFAIRGFTQEGKTSPSVGVYFADVVAPRSNGGTTSGNGAGVGQLFDLQNLQVLKGPQGTLFGRNTTGGAILLVPTKPTDRLEGYLEGSLGNYSMKRVQAVFNAPLSDTFRMRLGADWQKRDGYLRNRSPIGPKRQADVDYIALRLSIVADLTPDLENYTIASFSDSRTNGTTPRITICDPNFANPFFRGLSCAQVNRQTARGDGFWDIENNDPDPQMDFKQWQVINTTTWKASDSLTIKNIVSYAEFYEKSSFSLSGDYWPLSPSLFIPTINLHPGVSGYNSQQSTFTEELQFQGTAAEGRLDWQVGAYFELSKPLDFSSGLTNILLPCADARAFHCADVLPGIFGLPAGATVGSISGSNTKDTFNNKGIYGQATYDLTEQLSLTGGIRYTIDKMSNTAQNISYKFFTPNVPTMTCHNVVRFNSNPLTLAPLVVTDPTLCRAKISAKWKKPTWLLGLDFKPTEDVLLYAKWMRGYRQGAMNPNNIGIEVWGPEKVDTYEIGAKTTFRGPVPGTFNLAAFYNDFSDQQIAASLLPRPEFQGALGGAQAIVNAGKSRIWGIEADLSIRPFQGLRLNAAYAYLNTKLKELSLPETPPLYLPMFSSADVGGPLALSPKHRLTVDGSYTLPLPENIGAISFGATWTYTSTNNTVSPVVTPIYRIPSLNFVNLNANWNSVLGAPVDLSFFMSNATNEKYIVFPASTYRQFGFDGGPTNVPRMWGVRMKYRFGE